MAANRVVTEVPAALVCASGKAQATQGMPSTESLLIYYGSSKIGGGGNPRISIQEKSTCCPIQFMLVVSHTFGAQVASPWLSDKEMRSW